MDGSSLVAAQWSTGLLLGNNYNGFTNCGNLMYYSMSDLEMNFRTQPEIYNITSDFDYAQDQTMLLKMLDADPTNPDSLADPLTMYNGWFAA